uniref:Uncharacterized protein n=1 Tax=Schistocephalus solidus TaxID=70667 RepID=A0A0X3P8V0_SCHSO
MLSCSSNSITGDFGKAEWLNSFFDKNFAFQTNPIPPIPPTSNAFLTTINFKPAVIQIDISKPSNSYAFETGNIPNSLETATIFPPIKTKFSMIMSFLIIGDSYFYSIS